jgi:hypothetical protein
LVCSAQPGRFCRVHPRPHQHQVTVIRIIQGRAGGRAEARRCACTMQ